ncbi:ribulose-phosphate 3-epimerase [Candidatus Azambacteria bacterium]|nr:ribulose-phosphate 3-epimerase [Candidatus Azambacteria bacterium]
MTEIIPAIIAQDFKELQDKINLVEFCVDWVQIDVIVGIFVTSLNWNNPSEIKNLKTQINIEVHLMIDQPELVIDSWINSGAKRILVHYESTKKLDEVIDKIKKAGLEVGIVLKMETPIEVLDNFIDKIDVIQLMGIVEIGFYGQPFDHRVLKKISTLRKIYPNVIIEIDGGVTLEKAEALVKAGVNRLVAGSAIFKSNDIKETIEKLRVKS